MCLRVNIGVLLASWTGREVSNKSMLFNALPVLPGAVLGNILFGSIFVCITAILGPKPTHRLHFQEIKKFDFHFQNPLSIINI